MLGRRGFLRALGIGAAAGLAASMGLLPKGEIAARQPRFYLFNAKFMRERYMAKNDGLEIVRNVRVHSPAHPKGMPCKLHRIESQLEPGAFFLVWAPVDRKDWALIDPTAPCNWTVEHFEYQPSSP